MRFRMMVPKGRRASGRVTAPVVAAVLAAFVHLTPVAVASAQVQPVKWPNADVAYPSGQEGRVTGAIVSRRGDDILVRDETTKQFVIVSLGSGTRITQPTGFMKMDKKNRGDTSLVPGLVIVVKGRGGDKGNLVADKISFRKSSEKTAKQLAAGDLETKAFVGETRKLAEANQDSIEAANKRAKEARDRALDSLAVVNSRLANLDNYDTKFTTTVNFEVGKSELDAADKSALDDVAARVQGTEGYMIEVKGYADTTGSDLRNQRLSTARAMAVVHYLTQERQIPARRITAPTGFGTSNPVASNETADGRAQNRRAEVKILVNRGINPKP